MILYGAWTRLPIQTRNAIAVNFGILKKGSTEVFNNEIKSDGYSLADIESKLTVTALQAFLSSGETDIIQLWEKLIARIEGREPVIVPEASSTVTSASTSEPASFSGANYTSEPIEVPAKPKAKKTVKKGRPKKK